MFFSLDFSDMSDPNKVKDLFQDLEGTLHLILVYKTSLLVGPEGPTFCAPLGWVRCVNQIMVSSKIFTSRSIYLEVKNCLDFTRSWFSVAQTQIFSIYRPWSLESDLRIDHDTDWAIFSRRKQKPYQIKQIKQKILKCSLTILKHQNTPTLN